MQLRAEEVLQIDKPNEDFNKIFASRQKKSNNKMSSKVNPFVNKNNPFRR